MSSTKYGLIGGTNGFNSYLIIYPAIKSGCSVAATNQMKKYCRNKPGIAYQLAEDDKKEITALIRCCFIRRSNEKLHIQHSPIFAFIFLHRILGSYWLFDDSSRTLYCTEGKF